VRALLCVNTAIKPSLRLQAAPLRLSPAFDVTTDYGGLGTDSWGFCCDRFTVSCRQTRQSSPRLVRGRPDCGLAFLSLPSRQSAFKFQSLASQPAVFYQQQSLSVQVFRSCSRAQHTNAAIIHRNNRRV